MSISTGKTDKTVKGKYLDTENDVLSSTIKLREKDLESCRLMFGIGIESRPAKNDRLVIVSFGGSERNKVALGGVNEQIDPIVEDGEIRVFSTNVSGSTVQVNFHLKNDGTLDVDAEKKININAKENISIDSIMDIIFQSGSDNAVRYSGFASRITLVETLFNLFTQNQFNQHTHDIENVQAGSSTIASTKSNIQVGTVVINPIAGKINNIKVP